MTQLGLVYVAHSPTSAAAAESMEPSAGTLRAKVLELLRWQDAQLGRNGANPDLCGLTDEQIQEALSMPSSTQRPRRVELVRAGLVRDSGRVRPTRSGRMATIWVSA